MSVFNYNVRSDVCLLQWCVLTFGLYMSFGCLPDSPNRTRPGKRIILVTAIEYFDKLWFVDTVSAERVDNCGVCAVDLI